MENPIGADSDLEGASRKVDGDGVVRCRKAEVDAAGGDGTGGGAAREGWANAALPDDSVKRSGLGVGGYERHV